MRSTLMSVIKGKYITIEELPIGCVVTDNITNSGVIIGDLNDVDLLIESLQKLKNAWCGENNE